MKKLLFLVILISSLNVFGEITCNNNIAIIGSDTLFTSSGDTILCEIIAVGDFEIIYKPQTKNKERRIKKKDVNLISYSNGNRIFFNEEIEKNSRHKSHINASNIFFPALGIALGATIVCLAILIKNAW